MSDSFHYLISECLDARMRDRRYPRSFIFSLQIGTVPVLDLVGLLLVPR